MSVAEREAKMKEIGLPIPKRSLDQFNKELELMKMDNYKQNIIIRMARNKEHQNIGMKMDN